MVVLIIGFGSIAEKHYKVLQKIDPQVQVYALRSSSSASTIPGVINVYSYQEIKVKPDFIIISSPTFNHYQDILNCLSFKCPLFIEKPVVGSLQNSEELQKAISSSGIITYVACVLRFHPCLEYLKENVVSNNRINEMNVYCGSYLPDWRLGKDFRTQYSANRELGGGVHLDLIHELDYIYWFFGMPEYWHSYTSSKSSLSINSEDSASYLLSYKAFNVNIVLNYFRKLPKRTVELVTDKEVWEADLINYKITQNGKEIASFSNTTIMDLYEKQLRYFIEHIRKGNICENNFQNGLNVLKICLSNNYAKR